MNEQTNEENRIDIIGSNGGDGEHYDQGPVIEQTDEHPDSPLGEEHHAVAEGMMEVTGEELCVAIQVAQSVCHSLAVDAGWWNDLKTGEDMRGKRNVGELLCLAHSELSEAMEGHRKGLMDDKLPHRTMFEVELADTLIRIFDIAGGYSLDLGAALVEKLQYNQSRADHKPENRRADGGKAY